MSNWKDDSIFTSWLKTWKDSNVGKNYTIKLLKQRDLNKGFDAELDDGIDTETTWKINPMTYKIDAVKSIPSANDFYKKYEDDKMEAMLKVFSQNLLQTPMSPANPNAIMGGTGTASDGGSPPALLDKYPPINTAWKRYNPDSTMIGLPSILARCGPVMHRLQDIEEKNQSPHIFFAQHRKAHQDGEGVMDPWNRSMHHHHPHFHFKQIHKAQTVVEATYTKELLVWEIFTTLNKNPMHLFLWEEVKLSFVRQKTIDAFLGTLVPKMMKLDKLYEV